MLKMQFSVEDIIVTRNNQDVWITMYGTNYSIIHFTLFAFGV